MKRQYTHRASFCGVPCYFNINTGDMRGIGPISEWLLENWAGPWAESGNFIRQWLGFEAGYCVRIVRELNDAEGA